MEPFLPEPPPTDPFEGLSSLQDSGVSPTDFLSTAIEAEQEAPIGTRPGSLVPGASQELGIKLTSEQRNQLASELCSMLDAYDTAHKPMWEIEEEIRDAYGLKADSSQGGSSPGDDVLCSEMVMTMVDQSYARVWGAIEQAKPLIRVDPIQGAYAGSESAVELAASTESFINPYTFDEMDLRHSLPAAVQRLVKVGTAVFRVTWREEEESRWEWPVEGGPPRKVTIPRGRVEAKLVDNRLVKFWPPYITNWQDGYIFVGHESILAPAEWRSMAATLGISEEDRQKIQGDGNYNEIAKTSLDEAERHGIRGDQLLDEKLLKPVTACELWCNMVLPGKDVAEKFQVILHRESKTLVWIGYNAHHSGKHCYFPLRYKWNDSHGWGTGVGQEILQMWAADTAMFNLSLDNLRAGCYFILLRRPGSIYNTQSDNPRPGAQYVTDDPEKDFKTLKLGGEVPELGAARDDNYNRARMASGISSVASGIGDPVMKSGAGTGSTQALIDQAGIKMQMVDSNIRADLSEMYVHILELIQQYGQEGILVKHATAEDVSVLRELLYMPPRGQVSRLFRIRVEAPSANSTNDARQKTSMLIWNFAQQHVQTVNGIVMGLLQQQNPAAIPRWMEMCAGYLTAIAQKVADTADLPGIAELVPQVPQALPPDEVINQQQQQIGSLQQQLQEAQYMLSTLAQQGADMCQFQGQPGGAEGEVPEEQAVDPSMDPSMMQAAMAGGDDAYLS